MSERSESERCVDLVLMRDRRELSIGLRRDQDHEMLPGEMWEAREYLNRLADKPIMVERMRKLLDVYQYDKAKELRPAAVVTAVIRLVRNGRLTLERNPFELLPWPVSKKISNAPMREPAPQQRAASSSSSSTPASAAPEQMIDQDQQADTLERAAASGTPFCEECEKARREAA